MELQYQSYVSPLPEPLWLGILDLFAQVFDDQSQADFNAQLTYQQHRTDLHAVIALADGHVVGCKLGYERKPGHFYSWLGCVAPAFRGQGIATSLMQQQHDWCRQQAYHTIRTQTYNRWRAMLLLNLRSGFDVIGTVQGTHGLMIVLEKTL